MIVNFRHRGLKRLFLKGQRDGVPLKYADHIEIILSRLNESETIQGMNMPTYRLHPLKGALKGFWSMSVGRNWRIIFHFDEINAEALDVDLIGYH